MRLEPEFIWVGLGTPKQQRWIARMKPQLRRGMLLSVGQAFDVNAGLRSDAPAWMQRAGLTWLYRMASEPRRLVGRYLRHNSEFLWYLAVDFLRGRVYEGVARKPASGVFK
jgi:N-acetylglucosaminyldiphosphoundecaprenol N-acetyl-beta-D-mannosaminyltransferase